MNTQRADLGSDMATEVAVEIVSNSQEDLLSEQLPGVVPEPTERSVSAEPLLETTDQGDEPTNEPNTTTDVDPMAMDIERRLRSVLSSRPSIRMGARHNVSSPVRKSIFNRKQSARHSMPLINRSKSAKSLPDPTVRRKQLLKSKLLPSFSLGEFPLQKIHVQSPGSPESIATEQNGSAHDDRPTSIVLQDLEAGDVTVSPRIMSPSEAGTLERSSELRKSTMLLRDRILKQ